MNIAEIESTIQGLKQIPSIPSAFPLNPSPSMHDIWIGDAINLLEQQLAATSTPPQLGDEEMILAINIKLGYREDYELILTGRDAAVARAAEANRDLYWRAQIEALKQTHASYIEELLFQDKLAEAEAERRGIDTATTAYESTCKGLIEEAVKAGSDRICKALVDAGYFESSEEFYQSLQEDKE